MAAARPEWATPGHPDQVVVRTPLVTVGRFRCGVGDPFFRDSGPIPQPCFVFPRTAVLIQHADRPAFLADPSVVTFFNAGQIYQRKPVSAGGDRCDWYGVDPSFFRDIVRSFNPAAADDERPVQRSVGMSPPRLYLRQRRLFERLREHPAPDSLEIEETVGSLLRHALAAAYRGAPASGPHREPTARRRREWVDGARRLIAQRFAHPLSLSDIASRVGASPFHLSRCFRELVGMTLQDYRNQLRLRASLELIQDRVPLVAVALETGFSSHSHFTQAFRSTFGAVPSDAMPVRRALSARE